MVLWAHHHLSHGNLRLPIMCHGAPSRQSRWQISVLIYQEELSYYYRALQYIYLYKNPITSTLLPPTLQSQTREPPDPALFDGLGVDPFVNTVGTAPGIAGSCLSGPRVHCAVVMVL